MAIYIDPYNASYRIGILLEKVIKDTKAKDYKVEVSMLNDGSVYFKIHLKGTVIAYFSMMQMPNCCGICISYGAHVYRKYRGIGVGRALNWFRIQLAKEGRYTILMCADVRWNIAQRRTMIRNGWVDMFSFRNRNTSNTIKISYIKLYNRNPLYILRSWLVKYRPPRKPRALKNFNKKRSWRKLWLA